MHLSARPARKRNPHLDECRTRRVGSTIPGSGREMFYCMIDNEQCKYLWPFAFDNICKHPNADLLLAEESEGAAEEDPPACPAIRGGQTRQRHKSGAP